MLQQHFSDCNKFSGDNARSSLCFLVTSNGDFSYSISRALYKNIKALGAIFTEVLISKSPTVSSIVLFEKPDFKVFYESLKWGGATLPYYKDWKSRSRFSHH